jgi:hypothetical protein
MSFSDLKKYILTQKWDYGDFMIWAGLTILTTWIIYKLLIVIGWIP